MLNLFLRINLDKIEVMYVQTLITYCRQGSMVHTEESKMNDRPFSKMVKTCLYVCKNKLIGTMSFNSENT